MTEPTTPTSPPPTPTPEKLPSAAQGPKSIAALTEEEKKKRDAEIHRKRCEAAAKGREVQRLRREEERARNIGSGGLPISSTGSNEGVPVGGQGRPRTFTV